MSGFRICPPSVMQRIHKEIDGGVSGVLADNFYDILVRFNTGLVEFQRKLSLAICYEINVCLSCTFRERFDYLVIDIVKQKNGLFGLLPNLTDDFVDLFLPVGMCGFAGITPHGFLRHHGTTRSLLRDCFSTGGFIDRPHRLFGFIVTSSDCFLHIFRVSSRCFLCPCPGALGFVCSAVNRSEGFFQIAHNLLLFFHSLSNDSSIASPISGYLSPDCHKSTYRL